MESDPPEFEVGVTFYGDDFALTIRWTTSEGVDDETRANAAAEWFAAEYGFDPTEHTKHVTVEQIPQT